MQAIHWFPGHMAKARREMAESLRRVDAVVELVDARLPLASANPMLRQMMGDKPRLVVMTRIDLADPDKTREWYRYFERRGTPVIGLDARSGKGVDKILPGLEQATQEKRRRDQRRGIRPRPVRAMVVGIPNVGKSSLINRLARRAATSIGDRPGVTKTQQWIRLGQLELLDTPGVLWPKLEDADAAHKLALSGAIKPELLDPPTLCAYFLVWASGHYPDRLQDRYQLQDIPEAIRDADPLSAWAAAEPLIEQIAVRRGMLRHGGVPDVERAAELILREVQTGKLGRMTFEWAEEAETHAQGVEPATD
jgi:ribosome biogenesis GTPase A